MIDRGRRRLWLFATVTVVPAAALGILAFRSLRSEEIARRGQSEDQVRQFLEVASREIEADLRSRLATAMASPTPAPAALPEPDEPPDLGESIRREKPDLLPLFLRANELEHAKGRAKEASGLFLELAESLETPTTRGRLIAAAARAARKAGAASEATVLYETLVREHADVRGESLLPLGASARLHLIALGGDRERLGRELLALPLDPGSDLILLSRLEAAGLPIGDRLERARVLRRATGLGLREGETRWLPGDTGLWAVFLEGGLLRAERLAPVPSALVKARLEELGRVSGIAFGFSEHAPPGSMSVDLAAGAARIHAAVADPARLEALNSSRRMLVGALILLLVAAMAAGLVATLRAAQRETRLARLKSEFISGVSHELRTPLTSIRIFSDLLSTPGPAEKREEHAALLKREAERLSGLVERVLDFSRLEKDGATYRLEERDLAAVVDEAVRTFRAPKPGFSVSVIRSPEPLTARIDALGVEQIVHNLLDNAAKYAHPEAEVVIRREGGLAVLEVKDRGPGIAASDLPHVFETFYRGSSEVPGTGLGLAIVRQIAEAHGGRVRVASAPTEGATFSVEIPLCRASSS